MVSPKSKKIIRIFPFRASALFLTTLKPFTTFAIASIKNGTVPAVHKLKVVSFGFTTKITESYAINDTQNTSITMIMWISLPQKFNITSISTGAEKSS